MSNVVLVDYDDNDIGVESKERVHREGMLHRAFSVFIMDGNNVLLQKRAQQKYHSAGLWANACCSHPAPGELLASAAERRCAEELGVHVKPEKLSSFIYRAQVGNLIEFEYDHVFIAEYHGDVAFDKAEIERVEWVSFDQIKSDLVCRPELYAPWFFTAFDLLLKNAGCLCAQ